MDTLSKVRDMFYSGTHAFSGDAESVTEIAFLVDNGYLHVATVQINSKVEYSEILQNVGANPLYEAAAGGGPAHVALKILSGNYVRQKYSQDVIFEHPFCGYYPDVLSEDRQIVVECGNTQNPSKILDYFRQGRIRECIQIPYPDVEDTVIVWGTVSLHILN
ncbi:MAG: hypothetical protein AAB665_01905 [Patescibacteria group bacterium]